MHSSVEEQRLFASAKSVVDRIDMLTSFIDLDGIIWWSEDLEFRRDLAKETKRMPIVLGTELLIAAPVCAAGVHFEFVQHSLIAS